VNKNKDMKNYTDHFNGMEGESKVKVGGHSHTCA